MGEGRGEIERKNLAASHPAFFPPFLSPHRVRISLQNVTKREHVPGAKKKKKKCNEEPWILTLNFSTNFPFPIIRATIFSSLEFVQEEFKLFEVRKRY